MLHVIVGTLLLGACPGAVPGDGLDEIQQEFRSAYSKARGPQKRLEVVVEYTDQLFELAQSDPAARPKALLAVTELSSYAQGSDADGIWAEAVEILMQDYLDEPTLAPLAVALAQTQGERAEAADAYLEEIRESTGSDVVLAAIEYAETQPVMQLFHRNQEVANEELESAANRLSEALSVLRESSDAVAKDFAERADNDLFALRNLHVGAKVPDIVGHDTDGVEFKLSDYRGKVILLDFWAHW